MTWHNSHLAGAHNLDIQKNAGLETFSSLSFSFAGDASGPVSELTDGPPPE
jgi:hypothetical protein